MPVDQTVRGGWDIHTHLIPPTVVRAAEAGRFGMGLADGALEVCGHGVPLTRIADRGKLVDRLGADRLEGGVVSVPPPLFRPDLPAADRQSYAALINDSLLEACVVHKSNLRPLAYLPVEDPELAAKVATALGSEWAGVVLGTDMAGRSYADRCYHPLWDQLSAAALPIFVHPSASKDPRLGAFYLSNLIGNPYETTVIAAQFVFGCVLSRFPALKVILAHGGGSVAALCGRWQRGKETNRPGIPPDVPAPLDSVRRFYVDSLAHSAGYLRFIIDLLGPDRVLLGSDWPFPMGADNADHDLGALDPDLRRQIRCHNPAAVFGPRLLM